MQPLTDKLRDLSLPMLADTHEALAALLGKHSLRNPELQPVLLKDPGAALAILRQLHASRPDAAANVSDMAHAISMLGLGALEQVLEQTSVFTPDDSNRSRALMLAYSQAAHAAHFARFLASVRQLAKPDELATCALFQHLSTLALAVRDPEAVLRASYVIQQGVPTESAFRAELGVSPGLTDQQLAASWGLPALARAAMDDQDMLTPRSIPVRLAGDLAQVMTLGRCSEESNTLTVLLANYLDQAADRTVAQLHSEAARAARQLHPLGYPTAAFTCLLLPEAVDADEEMPEELIRLWAAKARRQRTAPVTASSPADAVRKDDSVAPSAPEGRARPDLQGVLKDTLQQMLTHTGAGRVMFAMVSRDRGQLRSRLVFTEDGDAQSTAELQRFAMPVGGRDVFSLLLKKTQSIWVHSDNLARYQAHLPPPLDGLPGEAGWLAMSLFVRNKPMGLFYADTAGSGHFSEQDYQRFRQLCQRATNGLNNLTRAA